MKTVAMLSLFLLASSAFGELTKEDARAIMGEENAASEKRLKEYIDLKIDGVEKSLNARIDGLEKSLNARIDATNARIDATNARIDGLEKNVDSGFDSVNKTLDRMWWLMIGFVGLITAAIAVPQIVIAYRDRGQKDMQTQIDQLREQLEALQTSSS